MPKKEYSIEDDHKAIKKQIKEWESRLDKIIIHLLLDHKKATMECVDQLRDVSNEMMSINM